MLARGLGNNSRRRPTLPQSFPCSTIGPGGLNFRVRDGIGCGPSGKTAGNLLPSDAIDGDLFKALFGVLSAIKRLRPHKRCVANKENNGGQAARPISTG